MTTTHPTTERRTKPRTAHACKADRCHQGHRACPVPQACELPDEEPATNGEITAFVCAVAAVIASVCLLVFLGTSA